MNRWGKLAAALPALAALLVAPDPVRFPLAAALFAAGALVLFLVGRSRAMLVAAALGAVATVLALLPVARPHGGDAAMRAAQATPPPCAAKAGQAQQMTRVLGPDAAWPGLIRPLPPCPPAPR